MLPLPPLLTTRMTTNSWIIVQLLDDMVDKYNWEQMIISGYMSSYVELEEEVSKKKYIYDLRRNGVYLTLTEDISSNSEFIMITIVHKGVNDPSVGTFKLITDARFDQEQILDIYYKALRRGKSYKKNNDCICCFNEIYNEDIVLPMVVFNSCLHTICLDCYLRLFSIQENGEFGTIESCPSCRNKSHITYCEDSWTSAFKRFRTSLIN